MSLTPATIDELRRAAVACSKCGFCLKACPTYQHTLDETYSPRGRIRLIRAVAEGELGRTRGYGDRIDSCTQCRACAAACPSGVRPDRLVLGAREDRVATGGVSPAKRLAYGVLAYQGVLRWSVAAFRTLRPVLARVLPGGSFRGISLAAVPTGPGTGRPLLDLVPRLNPAAGGQGPRGRVLFYPGCLYNQLLPRAGLAVIRVLQAAGLEVLLPRAVMCCGTPMIVGGDLATARRQAAANLELLDEAGVDAVITACGSGGTALRYEYPLLLGEGPYGDRAARLAGKVWDLTAFLAERVGLEFLRDARLELAVTYHEPCHLARGMGVREEPRTVLAAVPGVEFREMKDAGACCGAAGLFQFTHPHLAGSLTEAKVTDALGTGADLVATECPACLVRLESGLAQAGAPGRTAGVAEILARALSLDGEGTAGGGGFSAAGAKSKT